MVVFTRMKVQELGSHHRDLKCVAHCVSPEGRMSLSRGISFELLRGKIHGSSESNYFPAPGSRKALLPYQQV